MSLEIDVKFDENSKMWIFTPEGDIDIHTSTGFKDEVLKAFSARKSDIVLDGSRLDYIDSTGLGVLIFLLRTLQDENFKIYVDNIKPNIKKLFSITDLDKLFIFRGENIG